MGEYQVALGPCSHHITMLDSTCTFILKWESEIESLQLQMHSFVIVRIPRHRCCVESRIRGSKGGGVLESSVSNARSLTAHS